MGNIFLARICKTEVQILIGFSALASIASLCFEYFFIAPSETNDYFRLFSTINLQLMRRYIHVFPQPSCNAYVYMCVLMHVYICIHTHTHCQSCTLWTWQLKRSFWSHGQSLGAPGGAGGGGYDWLVHPGTANNCIKQEKYPFFSVKGN